jgi:hypothetical protein
MLEELLTTVTLSGSPDAKPYTDRFFNRCRS